MVFLTYVLLIIIQIVTSNGEFNIMEINSAEHNLVFEITNYNCKFRGEGFYIYDGPQIEIITFERLTEKSWIFIQSLVQTVIIKTGESSLCHNVVSQKEYDSRYTVKVGDDNCVSFVGFNLRTTFFFLLDGVPRFFFLKFCLKYFCVLQVLASIFECSCTPVPLVY